jgi:hypothetical protein
MHYYTVRSMRPVEIVIENTACANETKYIGVTLHSELTYSFHKSCILWKANYRLRQFVPIVNTSSTTDIYLALVINESFLRSILIYALLAWVINTYEG